MNLWLAIVLIVAFCIIGFVLGMTYRKKVAEREISSAEDEAKRIINDAIKSAESKKREALVEAKEEIHKSRSEFEREEKARRADLQKQERRLQQKEENLDRKTDSLERRNETLARKIADVENQQNEIALIKKSQLEMLEKVSGYTVDEAKAYLINALKDEVTHEMAVKVKEIEAQYKDEAEERAREIIVTAIQLLSLGDHFLNARRVDAPVGNELFKSKTRHLAANGVKARYGYRLGRIVDDKIAACQRLYAADVAALAADDASLHLVVGEWYDGYGDFTCMVCRAALDSRNDDLACAFLGLVLVLGLDLLARVSARCSKRTSTV